MEKASNQSPQHADINQNFPINSSEPLVSSSPPSKEAFGINSSFFIQMKQKLYPSFFSAKGLAQDILEVTQAEPDIPLNAFIALKPQIEKLIENQNPSKKTHLRDKWTNFLGTFTNQGILYSPEYLIGDQDASQLLARLPQEEGDVFKLFQQVVENINTLEEQIASLGNFDEKENILKLLRDTRTFYNDYKAKILAFCRGDNRIETKDLIELSRLIRPKAIMFGELLPKGPAYRISKEIAYQILSLDNHGIPLPKRPKSNHRVSSLPFDKSSRIKENPRVFFKVDDGLSPLKPGNEVMLYSFYRLLNIPLPQTGLLMITGINNNSLFYIVQASEAVVGESPEADLSFQDENFESFCQQTVGAILTNPNDGKPANFIYHKEKFGLVSIDNDDVFCCDFSQTWEKKDYLIQTKSLLFCLQAMEKPLTRSLSSSLTTLDPQLLLLAWLDQLNQKNQEYEFLKSVLCFENTRQKFQRNIQNHEEFIPVNKLLEEPLTFSSSMEQSFLSVLSLPITPSSQLFETLQRKLSQMIKALSNNPQMTLQELFETISPCLAAFYKKLRSKFPRSPLEAIAALYAADGPSSDCTRLSSLIDISSLELVSPEIGSSEGEIYMQPEALFSVLYQSVEKLDVHLFDKFVKKYGERRMKGLLEPEEALKELFHLLNLKLAHFRDAQNIVDFWYKGRRNIQNNTSLIQKWDVLFFSLDRHPELKWLFCLEKYFSRGWKNSENDFPKELLDVKGAFIGKRCLSESMAKHIFDKSGAFKKERSLTGRSKVARFPSENPIFYFEKSPEIPGFEYASALFMRSLGLEDVPYSELLLSWGPSEGVYSVLLTQAVQGMTLDKIWHDERNLTSLDPHHTYLLILCSILLNPEDGKGDNYVLTPDRRRIIPIDNDHVFLPGAIQEERGFFSKTIFTELQSKTVLYCLHEMDKPIPLSVTKIFAQLDIDKFLDTWFKKLVIVDENYQNLPPKDLLLKEGEKGTFFRIVLPQEYIKNLYFKLSRMKELLSMERELTPFAILKSIEPYVEKLYSEVFYKESSVYKRFMRVTETLYKKDRNGNQISSLNSIQMFKIFDVPRAELVDQAFLRRMSPLETLEILRIYKEQVKNKENSYQDIIEGKAELSKIDASNYSEKEEKSTLKRVLSQNREALAYHNSNYLSLKTLSFIFGSLPLINACNKLRLLDLRGAQNLASPYLAHFISTFCPNLEYLNLSANPALQALVFSRENFYNLKRLIVSDCRNLTGLVLEPAFLDVLEVNNNERLSLVLLDTPNLTYFDWTATNITSLIHCFSRMDKLQIVKKNVNGRKDCFFNIGELCDALAGEISLKQQEMETKRAEIGQLLPFDEVLNEVRKILDRIEIEKGKKQQNEASSPRKKLPIELEEPVNKMVEMLNLFFWLIKFSSRLDYLQNGLGVQEAGFRVFETALDLHEKILQRPFGILGKIRLALRKVNELKNKVEQLQKRARGISKKIGEISDEILATFKRMGDMELMTFTVENNNKLDKNLEPNLDP